MILSGIEIKNRLGKDIFIDPFDEKRLNPNSYNLRLANDILMYGKRNEINDFVKPTLDMKKQNEFVRGKIPEEGMVIYPGQLYLGRTMEMTETKNLVPMIEGRSSVGRLGIFIHITAGFGDVGFKGFWTLEISCIQPVRIYAGVEICQVFYHTVTEPFEEYKSGKYQGNTEVQPSMLWKDFI
jgi:dCTP deaminase